MKRLSKRFSRRSSGSSYRSGASSKRDSLESKITDVEQLSKRDSFTSRASSANLSSGLLRRRDSDEDDDASSFYAPTVVDGDDKERSSNNNMNQRGSVDSRRSSFTTNNPRNSVDSRRSSFMTNNPRSSVDSRRSSFMSNNQRKSVESGFMSSNQRNSVDSRRSSFMSTASAASRFTTNLNNKANDSNIRNSVDSRRSSVASNVSAASRFASNAVVTSAKRRDEVPLEDNDACKALQSEIADLCVEANKTLAKYQSSNLQEVDDAEDVDALYFKIAEIVKVVVQNLVQQKRGSEKNRDACLIELANLAMAVGPIWFSQFDLLHICGAYCERERRSIPEIGRIVLECVIRTLETASRAKPLMINDELDETLGSANLEMSVQLIRSPYFCSPLTATLGGFNHVNSAMDPVDEMREDFHRFDDALCDPISLKGYEEDGDAEYLTGEGLHLLGEFVDPMLREFLSLPVDETLLMIVTDRKLETIVDAVVFKYRGTGTLGELYALVNAALKEKRAPYRLGYTNVFHWFAMMSEAEREKEEVFRYLLGPKRCVHNLSAYPESIPYLNVPSSMLPLKDATGTRTKVRTIITTGDGSGASSRSRSFPHVKSIIYMAGRVSEENCQALETQIKHIQTSEKLEAVKHVVRRNKYYFGGTDLLPAICELRRL